MKSFTHMSCKFIRLLETIFIFSKTIPAYLQYGKELFAGWSHHTHLTGLPRPDPSPIGRPWDILGRWLHDRIPSQLPHFLISNSSWLNNGNVFHKGLGAQPQTSLEQAQKPHRMHSLRWRSYKIWLAIYKCILLHVHVFIYSAHWASQIVIKKLLALFTFSLESQNGICPNCMYCSTGHNKELIWF